MLSSRKFLIVIFTALFFSACSSTPEKKPGQSKIKNEKKNNVVKKSPFTRVKNIEKRHYMPHLSSRKFT